MLFFFPQYVRAERVSNFFAFSKKVGEFWPPLPPEFFCEALKKVDCFRKTPGSSQIVPELSKTPKELSKNTRDFPKTPGKLL
jgi:hypothetical protein